MKIALKKPKHKKKIRNIRDIDSEWREFKIPSVSLKIPRGTPIKQYGYSWHSRGLGFFPMILLIAALFWLLRNLGYISEQVFWPALLFAIALYLILRRFRS